MDEDDLGPAVEVLDLDELCAPVARPRLSRQLTALADMNELRGGTPPQPVNVLMIGSGEALIRMSHSYFHNSQSIILRRIHYWICSWASVDVGQKRWRYCFGPVLLVLIHISHIF